MARRVVLVTLLARAGCAAVAVAAASGAGVCTHAAGLCESEPFDATNLLQVSSGRLEKEAPMRARAAGEGPVPAAALRTSTRQAPGRAVHFASVNTLGPPLLEKVGPPGQPVHNPGQGQEWEGYESKLKMLLPFLHTLPDQDLLAFVDGEDVVWGGCDVADFVHAYERIVNASGAPLVFSADLWCYENPCDQVPPVPKWAVELAGGRDLGGDFWTDLAGPCIGCMKPMSFRFLNSGFFMGPVHEIVEMVEWGLKNYHNLGKWILPNDIMRLGREADGHSDQAVFAQFWMDFPEKAALDYTGELCLNFVQPVTEELVSVDVERRTVTFPEFDRVQCLIHGPGYSNVEPLSKIMTELVPPGWECAPLQDGLTEESCKEGVTLNGYEHWYVAGRDKAYPRPCGKCPCCRKKV